MAALFTLLQICRILGSRSESKRWSGFVEEKITYSFASIILPILGASRADVSSLVHTYTQTLSEIPVPSELILVVHEPDKENLSQSLPEDNENIRYVLTPQPGWGAAVRTGLKNARGDLLAYTNWLSTKPKNLTLILSVALANPNMVIKATRRVDGHWIRRLGGVFYTAECRFLFDLPYWDINATPKAFPSSFDQLLELQSDDFLLETEFCVVCRTKPYPVLEVPVDLQRDFTRLSIGGWLVDTKLYWGAIRLRQRLSRTY
jgi:hypothetical protein